MSITISEKEQLILLKYIEYITQYKAKGNAGKIAAVKKLCERHGLSVDEEQSTLEKFNEIGVISYEF